MRYFHVFAVLMESHNPICHNADGTLFVGGPTSTASRLTLPNVPLAMEAAIRQHGDKVMRFEVYPVPPEESQTVAERAYAPQGSFGNVASCHDPHREGTRPAVVLGPGYLPGLRAGVQRAGGNAPAGAWGVPDDAGGVLPPVLRVYRCLL